MTTHVNMAHIEPPMRHYTETKTSLTSIDLRAILEKHFSLVFLVKLTPKTLVHHICVKERDMQLRIDSTYCLRSHKTVTMFTKYWFTSIARQCIRLPGRSLVHLTYTTPATLRSHSEWSTSSVSYRNTQMVTKEHISKKVALPLTKMTVCFI